MRKVAIIGLADSTHNDAPWDDPEWEKWGLPWDAGYWARCDRLFEMHDLRLLEGADCRRDGYLDLLQQVDVPLYMQSRYFDNVTQYPFDEVAETTGNYFNSSIGYMLALAIHERAEQIGVWGVDMNVDDEYFYQRPNCEYLLGLALGMGIDITLPEETPLLKFEGKGIFFGANMPEYKGRYGWLGGYN